MTAEETGATELTAEEVKATKNGWKPKAEWEGESDTWVSAKEFNERGRMIGKLMQEERRNNRLAEELNEVKASMKTLSEHNRKIAEQTRKDTIAELKAMKKSALKDGDYDSLVEIDDKISDIKELDREAALTESTQNTSPGPTNPPPEAQAWLDENSGWYNDNNPILKQAFDGIVISTINEDPSLKNDPKAVLQKATESLKEEFPEKFKVGSRATKQEMLEPGDKSRKSSTKYSVSQMSAEQKEVATKLIGAGATITMEEYAKQLGELGELGV